MDAIRFRPRIQWTAVMEWAVAASFLVATVAVGVLLFAQFRPMPVARAAAATSAQPPVDTIPAAVPARAVSVPLLPFVDGKEIRLGETVSAIALRLGRAAENGRQEVDRGSLGERLTRFYEYSGSRFVLVFEPFERNGEARVSAIYLP
jgi:hypothetical protein